MSKAEKNKRQFIHKRTFISFLKKFYQLLLDFQGLSIQIGIQCRNQNKTSVEKQRLEDDLEKRMRIIKLFAGSGIPIYREAVRLQLPTRPDNVLHLAANWLNSSNDKEIKDIIEKAEAELLQMILETQALVRNIINSKKRTNDKTNTKQTSNKVVKIQKEKPTKKNTSTGTRYVSLASTSRFKDDKKEETKYSKPLFPKDWAKIFNVHRNQIYKYNKEQVYHFRKISKRKWALPLNELPAEYLEKYRNITA
jgi:hypothetical protein